MTTLAAQYLRMSTEHQQYSMANQSAAIGEFAKAHGFEIVATYSDEARSGLTIAERPGLRMLIEDITLGRAEFAAVLVLDVSRGADFKTQTRPPTMSFCARSAGSRFCTVPNVFRTLKA